MLSSSVAQRRDIPVADCTNFWFPPALYFSKVQHFDIPAYVVNVSKKNKLIPLMYIMIFVHSYYLWQLFVQDNFIKVVIIRL